MTERKNERKEERKRTHKLLQNVRKKTGNDNCNELVLLKHHLCNAEQF
jgi:hypothetical protein